MRRFIEDSLIEWSELVAQNPLSIFLLPLILLAIPLALGAIIFFIVGPWLMIFSDAEIITRAFGSRTDGIILLVMEVVMGIGIALAVAGDSVKRKRDIQ